MREMGRGGYGVLLMLEGWLYDWSFFMSRGREVGLTERGVMR